MKIHEYNEMMAYLTRPAAPTRQPVVQGGVIGEGGMFQGQDMGYRTGFSSYQNILVTPSVAKNAGINISSLSPEYQKLFNEGNLHYTRIKQKNDIRRAIFGNREKIDIILGNTIPSDISKLPDEVSNAGKLAKKIRINFIQEYLETLPKGDVINLDATARLLDEKLQAATNSKITMGDKYPLIEVLENPKLNTNKIRKPKNLKEAKKIFFKEYAVDWDTVNAKAAELNKKYNLEDKGISFKAHKTTGDSTAMRLTFTGSPYLDKNKIRQAKNIDRAASTKGITELENELKKVMDTDVFKKYSKVEAAKIGGKKTSKAMVKYNQPEVFEYLSKSEGAINLKQVAKDLKMKPEILDKAIKNLHQNIYFSANPKSVQGRFLEGYNYDELMKVKNRILTLPSKYHNRTLENLLIDAYGEVPEKLKPLMDKLEKFRELQSKLPEEYRK